MLKFWDLSGAKDCKSCRSRKTLQNDYLVAIVAVDTAENEPSKVWTEASKRYPPPVINAALGYPGNPPRLVSSRSDCPGRALKHAVGHDTSLFSRLVLGCIETKFCNQIRIFQVFRDLQNYLADFLKKLQNFAKNRKVCKILRIFRIFAKKSVDFCENRWFFTKFCKFFENLAR